MNPTRLNSQFVKRLFFLSTLLPLSICLHGCGIFQRHELGDTQERPTDGMIMVYVPAGEFQMGSDRDMFNYARQLCKDLYGEPALAVCKPESYMDEYPAHTVRLDAFWIDRTEVTNGQYQKCVAAGVCDPPLESGSFTRETYFGDPAYDDYPVVNVNWTMAEAYCAWAGARLPTEAEWEYSARGPENRLFPWGDEFDKTRLNYCDVTCKGVSDDSYDDGYPDTAPVGSFPQGASWVGALDMAGNVREWVADWSSGYSLGDLVNPSGPEQGTGKVMRGGSWYDRPDVVRGAHRGDSPPDYYRHKLGIRCAKDE